MAKRCDLTNVGVQTGNNVSHSKRKTRRRFLPNLQKVSLISAALRKSISFKITAATLRSVDHNGGLDNFLLTTHSSNLSLTAQKLKRQIKKVVSTDKKDTPKKANAKVAKKSDDKESAATA